SFRLHEVLRNVGQLLAAEVRTEVTSLVREVEGLLRRAATDDEAIIALRTMRALTDEIKMRTAEGRGWLIHSTLRAISQLRTNLLRPSTVTQSIAGHETAQLNIVRR